MGNALSKRGLSGGAGSGRHVGVQGGTHYPFADPLPEGQPDKPESVA